MREELHCKESYSDLHKQDFMRNGKKMTDTMNKCPTCGAERVDAFKTAWSEWDKRANEILADYFGKFPTCVPAKYLGWHKVDVLADIIKTQQQAINILNVRLNSGIK